MLLWRNFYGQAKYMRITRLFFTGILILSITACNSYDFSRKVVQQGNLLPHAKISRLHLGMSKTDVEILMGSTLMAPTFNNDRWDYAYTIRKGNGELCVHNLTLFFNRGVLARIEDHPKLVSH